MSPSAHKFHVILCEDIREEVGGKRSLMGIFAGDIIVQTLPAQIQLAAYIEYTPDASDGERATFDIRMMQDDIEMVRARADVSIERGKVATLLLPRGLATFQKDCMFRLLIAVNGGEEVEAIAKRIQEGPIS